MARKYDPVKRHRWYLRRKASRYGDILDEGKRSGITQFLKKIGVSRTEYEEALAKQEGKCAICGGLPQYGRRLSIDHDHVVGGFRGLLCTHCNLAMGHFFDSTELMEKAIKYVEAHRAGKVQETDEIHAGLCSQP